jgi:hypothetical protein
MPSAFSRERINVIVTKFDELLSELRAAKPNDRSIADRYMAFTITEVEKAKAIFIVYVEAQE